MAMSLGYFLNVTWFFSELTTVFIKKKRKQHSFKSRLKQIKYLMDDWQVSKEMRNKTLVYYNELWTRRNGYKDIPAIFYKLPRSLQLEVNMDIFWEALRHSHVFNSVDIPFKRELSSKMKSEFFLPGDFIYKKNEPKNKMVYIVSGVIQVLSDEDDESAIISFSAGTLLGELACLMPLLSTVNVKCATYCEVHTLALVDLYNEISTLKNRTKHLLNVRCSCRRLSHLENR